MTERERHGLAFAGLCAANGALVPAFAKLTTGEASALFVASMTTLFAGVFAAFVLWLRGELGVLGRGPQRARLAFVGALGTAAAFVLFYAGAQRTSAINTALCLQIEPAYSLIVAWVFLGHRPDRRRIVATITLMLGIALAVGASGLTSSAGVWMLLATPICWQVSHLVVLRTLQGTQAAVLTGARYVFGAALLVPVWLVTTRGYDLPPASEMIRLCPLLAFQGVVLSYGGTWFWYQAILRLDLARATAIVVPSIPMLSLVASFLLLGEVPTVRQWLGLGLVATGVLTFVSAPDAVTRRTIEM